MSAIDITKPADGDAVSQGASRMRETRTWLFDLWEGFKARVQDGGVPGDPSTSTGFLKVPVSAPVSPQVGDFHVTDAGLLYSYKAGPTQQLTGDLDTGTVATFRQSSAPTGWTRQTGLQDASFLRYVASGAPSSGGTTDPGTTLTHAETIVHRGGMVGAPPFNIYFSLTTGSFSEVPDHPSGGYLFLDVMLATKS